MDFAVVYNLDEDVADGYTDWISPLNDHSRVSFAIRDSIWGDIPTPKPATSPKGTSSHIDQLTYEKYLAVGRWN